MNKYILLLISMILILACETGTRYDKNATTQKVPKFQSPSGLVNRDDIEALLDDKEIEAEQYYNREYIEKEVTENEVEAEIASFSSGTITDGLDVRTIREGKHNDYIRLVFDVYDDAKPAKEVGFYDAKHSNSQKDITVTLNGYRKFTAPLPSFSSSSIVEQIYFEKYLDDSGFKFHIKLRENAKVKIFDLKNPARIVFDIKPI